MLGGDRRCLPLTLHAGVLAKLAHPARLAEAGPRGGVAGRPVLAGAHRAAAVAEGALGAGRLARQAQPAWPAGAGAVAVVALCAVLTDAAQTALRTIHCTANGQK